MKSTRDEINQAVREFTTEYWTSGMDVAHEPFSDDKVYEELFVETLGTKPEAVRLALLEVRDYCKLIYDCKDYSHGVKIVSLKATKTFAREFLKRNKSDKPTSPKPPTMKAPTMKPEQPMKASRSSLGPLLSVVSKEVLALVETAVASLTTTKNERHANDVQVWKELSEYTLYDNSRPLRRYGQCSYYKRVIEVHPILHRVEGEYQKTLIHEIAHALEFAVYKTTGHGASWKRCMRALGVASSDISRCNSLGLLHEERVLRADKKREKVGSNELTKWTYTCSGCGHKINTSRKLSHVDERYHKGCKGEGLTEQRNW